MPPRLPVAPAGRQSVPSTRESVARRERDPLGRGTRAGRQRRAEHGRHRIGHLARPRVRPGRRPGRAAATGPAARISRSPIAATQAPSASQPTARQTPSHGLIRLPVGRRADGPGRLRRAAAAALGRLRPAELADEQVLQAVVDLDVDEPAAVRRRQRSVTGAAAGFAVLALPGGQDDPIVPVGGQPDDLEPAVRVRHEQQRAIGQPARRRHRRCARRRRPASRRVATSTSAIWEVSRSVLALAMIAIRRAVGRPLEGVDVDPGLGQDGRPRRLAARSPAGRGAGPARRSARPGSSRDVATGRRAGGRRATSAARDRRPAWPTTRVRRDPSASTTQISSSRTNARRRPSGDHCGSETGFSEAVSWVG